MVNDLPREDLIKELRMTTFKDANGDTVECEYCSKMTSKANISRHTKICKAKSSHTMDTLHDEITKLRQEIQNIRGNNTNNNTCISVVGKNERDKRCYIICL